MEECSTCKTSRMWNVTYCLICIRFGFRFSLYLTSIEGFILCFPGLQGLCEWRDIVARAEDESTGYVLPNKSVLEIGMKLVQVLVILMLSIWLYVHSLICIYFFKS